MSHSLCIGRPPILEILTMPNSPLQEIILIILCKCRPNFASGWTRHAVLHIIYALFERATCSSPEGDHSPLHFHVGETCLEVLCRQMILLCIFLEPLSESHFGQVFLEIYGNTRLSSRSNDYLRDVAHKWIRFIAFDENIRLGHFSKKQIVKLDSLKYKERDLMEKIFRDMVSGVYNADNFQIEQMRDIQIRQISRCLCSSMKDTKRTTGFAF